METWPLTLQQKLNVAGFRVQVGSTVVRSSMDTGPGKVRRRFTDGVDRYSCTIDLDFDLYQTFRTFFDTQLAGGAMTFEFVDPFSQTPEIFRFAEEPSIDPLGGRVFRVGMVWEKIP